MTAPTLPEYLQALELEMAPNAAPHPNGSAKPSEPDRAEVPAVAAPVEPCLYYRKACDCGLRGLCLECA